MTAFFKGKAIGQVDVILIDGKSYKREDFIKMIKNEETTKISPAK